MGAGPDSGLPGTARRPSIRRAPGVRPPTRAPRQVPRPRRPARSIAACAAPRPIDARSPAARRRRTARCSRASPASVIVSNVWPRSSMVRTMPATTSCAWRNGMPRADQVIGDVGRQHEPAGGRPRRVPTCIDRLGDHRRGRRQRSEQRVLRVEHRLLVFLQVLVVPARQPLHRRQPAGEPADRAAGSCRARARADRDSSSAASGCCRSRRDRRDRRIRTPRCRR